MFSLFTSLRHLQRKEKSEKNSELEPQQHTQSEDDPEVLVLYHSAGWIVGIVVSRTSLI